MLFQIHTFEDIFTNVELGIGQLVVETAKQVRRKTSGMILKSSPTKKILLTGEKELSKNLNNDRHIIILTANNGNVTVMMLPFD